MGLITTLQDAVKTQVGNESYFNGVTVMSDDVGDLQSELTKALKRHGLLVLVVTPEIIRSGEPDVFNAQLAVTVTEAVALNRSTGGTVKKGPDVAEAVFQILNGYRPAETWSQLRGQSIRLANPSPLLVWEVIFQTKTKLIQN